MCHYDTVRKSDEPIKRTAKLQDCIISRFAKILRGFESRRDRNYKCLKLLRVEKGRQLAVLN